MYYFISYGQVSILNHKMEIDAIGLSLPTWKLGNNEVISYIRHASKPVFQGNLEKTLRKISLLLDKSGAVSRHWLNRGKGEKPIHHIEKAAEEALARSSLDKKAYR